MATKMPGIYEIKNKVTGDIYVGQSIDLIGRWGGHFRRLAKGTHNNKKLQADFAKYGSTAFTCRPIQFCLVEELCEKEAYWKEKLGATYNQAEPPKQIRRDHPRFNPTIQEIRRQQRQRQRRSTQ